MGPGLFTLAPAACGLALGMGSAVAPPAPSGGPAPWAAAPRSLCLAVGLDVAGRLRAELPDLGVARAFSLPRAHLEVRLDFGGLAAARVELAAVRSGGETGYVGVDGESFVPRVQIAEARLAWAAAGLSIALGLVDDPWVSLGDAVWGLRAVAPGLGEDQGWLERSDLGGMIAWTSPRAIVTASVSMTSGEGLRFRERNDGKDLTGVVTLRPLGLFGGAAGAERLEVSFMARDGSRGLDSARDHRLGGRATLRLGTFGVGVEALAASGVGGDATRTPVGFSAFARAERLGPALAFVRLDATSEDLGNRAAGTVSFLGGAGIDWPWQGSVRPLSLVVAYEGSRAGAAVSPVAGATEAAVSHAVWVQLGFRLGGALELARTGGAGAPDAGTPASAPSPASRPATAAPDPAPPESAPPSPESAPAPGPAPVSPGATPAPEPVC